MKSICPFYIVFEVSKVLLIKICKIQLADLFISCCFYYVLPQQISFFHKFLELHSILSEKKIFVTNFPFLTDSLKPPHPVNINGQNLLSVRKVFCWCSLSCYLAWLYL